MQNQVYSRARFAVKRKNIAFFFTCFKIMGCFFETQMNSNPIDCGGRKLHFNDRWILSFALQMAFESQLLYRIGDEYSVRQFSAYLNAMIFYSNGVV
jgi:hypothetical protein